MLLRRHKHLSFDIEKLSGRNSYILQCHKFPDTVISFPIDWNMDPHQNLLWRHRLNSLNWLAGQDENVIFFFLLDFFQYHYERKLPNKLFDSLSGDHATAIRMKVLRESFGKFQAIGHFDGLKLCQELIKGDVNSALKEENYRAGHNHGLMTDLAILELIENIPELSEIFDRDYVWDRMLKSLNQVFDFKTGLSLEHAVEYQRFNTNILADISQFIQSGNLADDITPARQIERLHETAVRATELLLNLALRADGTFFPLGDSPRAKCGRRVAKDSLNPVAVDNLSFWVTPIGFGFFKGFLKTHSNIDLSIVCGWNSYAHKQNDEFSICLDYAGTVFFDEVGFSNNMTEERKKNFRSEHAHNTVTLTSQAWNSVRECDHSSKLKGYPLGENGCVFIAKHRRIPGFAMRRELAILQNSLLISDMMTGASTVQSRHRFILGANVTVTAKNGGLTLAAEGHTARFSCLYPDFEINVSEIEVVAKDPIELERREVIDFIINLEPSKTAQFFITFDETPLANFKAGVATFQK